MTWREGQAGEWRIISAALFAVTLGAKPVDVSAFSAGGLKPAVAAVMGAVARRTRGIFTRNTHQTTRLQIPLSSYDISHVQHVNYLSLFGLVKHCTGVSNIMIPPLIRLYCAVGINFGLYRNK